MRLRILNGEVVVTLSRRNLQVLIEKLNGNPPNSACTIYTQDDTEGLRLVVHAEEDAEHYRQRPYPPGVMHPDTEDALRGVF